MVGHQQQQGVDVVLQRDSVAQPWGFRLQGGNESGTPLTIQRVFVGGSSDGRLQRGDVVVAIDGHDTSQLAHRDADWLIQQARNVLRLTVQRGSHHTYAHSTASEPTYYKREGPEEDNSNQSVSSMREYFAEPQPHHHNHHQHRGSKQEAGVIHLNPQPGMTSYLAKRPAVWQKKEAPPGAGLMDPGWVPHLGPSRQHAPGSSRQYRGPPPGSSRGTSHSMPVNRAPSEPVSMPQERHEPPAWAGSLRRSGGVRLWEVEEGEVLARGGAPMTGRRHSPPRAVSYGPTVLASHGGGDTVVAHNPRLQTVRYGPNGSTYEQHDAYQGNSDTARVAHLQYNSPIGLYSRDNAKDALNGQTRGKAGQGTMQITGDGRGAVKAFDPANSDVFRLIAEEEAMRNARQQGPARPTSSTRSHQPQQHQQQQHHHHPQQQQQHRGVESQFADMGISDF